MLQKCSQPLAICSVSPDHAITSAKGLPAFSSLFSSLTSKCCHIGLKLPQPFLTVHDAPYLYNTVPFALHLQQPSSLFKSFNSINNPWHFLVCSLYVTAQICLQAATQWIFSNKQNHGQPHVWSLDHTIIGTIRADAMHLGALVYRPPREKRYIEKKRAMKIYVKKL